MDGDLFLRWLSLRGSGNLSDVARTALGQTDSTKPASLSAARSYLRGLQNLGHIDLSWTENTWRTRQLTFTHLPGTSAFALVNGARSTELYSVLNSEFLFHELPAARKEGALFADPTTLVVEFDDEDDLRGAATKLNGVFVPCSAFSIAASLAPIQTGPRAASPNFQGAPLEMYDIAALRFIGVDFPRKSGLFRQLANGRYNYWVFKDASWGWTNYEEGICLVWGEAGKNGLKLTIRQDAADAVGTLHVDPRLPLPPKHRRALTLCSGFNPREGVKSMEYLNVPASVATSVASSLHQRLAIV